MHEKLFQYFVLSWLYLHFIAFNLKIKNIERTMVSFYLLRHGESEANVAGIISSGSVARVSHGLTSLGEDQARAAGRHFVAECNENGFGDVHCRVVSSPLLRAKQTADLFVKGIREGSTSSAVDIVRIEDEDLRERSFGSLDGKSNTHYEQGQKMLTLSTRVGRLRV